MPVTDGRFLEHRQWRREEGHMGGWARHLPRKLEKAEGAAFDKQFLHMMIQHHTGAIEMARTEQSQGSNPEAKEPAKTIETAQQAEVEQMRKILDRLQAWMSAARDCSRAADGRVAAGEGAGQSVSSEWQ
ncbi:DUF305 domain-containing protein [Nonomuraea sp. NPDC050733]